MSQLQDPFDSDLVFLLGEIKDIFSFVLFSPKEKKRKDNYRYLQQQITEIVIITQPYKLCTKRETTVGMVLSKRQRSYRLSNTLFTSAKHVLLNWFLLNENHKQRTEKLTCVYNVLQFNKKYKVQQFLRRKKT